MNRDFRNGWFAGYIVATTLYIVFTIVMILMSPSAKADDCTETDCLYDNCSVECAIASEARKQHVPVHVALAVAKVESRLNQSARGPFGEVGVFQIRPEYTHANVYDLKTNIAEGIRQLRFWMYNCPVQEGITWVSCYNQGARHPRYPYLFPYVRKVMAEL